jgi:hypothetical protein
VGGIFRALPAGEEERAWREALVTVIRGFRARRGEPATRLLLRTTMDVDDFTSSVFEVVTTVE